jgi:hypothetical protein
LVYTASLASSQRADPRNRNQDGGGRLDILLLILRDNLRITIFGVHAGLITALGLSRLLHSCCLESGRMIRQALLPWHS